MKEIVAMILAGGKTTSGYGVLALNRAKAAIPFCGRYRLIDFALSNLSNSNIERVGIITQYLPASLMGHIGIGSSWDLDGFGRAAKIMPPFIGINNTEWYLGTADAIYRNLNFIEEWNPKLVLVLAGDHIYTMDYRHLIGYHIEKQADLTIVYKRINPKPSDTQFGYLNIDNNHRVTNFVEKPETPISDTISLGIYLFNREILEQALEDDAKSPTYHNISADVVAKVVREKTVYGYEFKGFWEYLKDINEYFEVHMKFLNDDNIFDLEKAGIRTNLYDRNTGFRPPIFISPNAIVEKSIISLGCKISGKAYQSILSPGVIIEEGAEVIDSIIMHDCIIKKGAKLKRVVSDKDSIFDENSQVNFTDTSNLVPPPDLVPNTTLTTIGKNVRVEKNSKISAGCQIYPNKIINEGCEIPNFSVIK